MRFESIQRQYTDDVSLQLVVYPPRRHTHSSTMDRNRDSFASPFFRRSALMAASTPPPTASSSKTLKGILAGEFAWFEADDIFSFLGQGSCRVTKALSRLQSICLHSWGDVVRYLSSEVSSSSVTLRSGCDRTRNAEKALTKLLLSLSNSAIVCLQRFRANAPDSWL